MWQKKINTFAIENIKNKEKAEVRCNKKAEGEEATRTKLLEKKENVVHNAVHNTVLKCHLRV